jgi:hypothetical protein
MNKQTRKKIALGIIAGIILVCIVVNVSFWLQFLGIPQAAFPWLPCSRSFADAEFCYRISAALTDDGIDVRGISISADDLNTLRVVYIDVGETIFSQDAEAYQLVSIIHSVVVQASQATTRDLLRIDYITVEIFGEEHQSVAIRFDAAYQYYFGQISHEDYFSQWGGDSVVPIEP